MEFPTWEPTYREILEDMGYSEEADRAAAERLDDLLEGADPVAEGRLRLLFQGNHVVIFGGAPDLQETVGPFRDYRGTKVASDGSLPVLLDAGLVPDLVTTDLDASPEEQVRRSADGVPIAVHAHGDNRDALDRWVPKLDGPVLGTCQCSSEGLKRVVNYGGFTDGDRAACLGAHFGARRLVLVGWDFDAASGAKLEKLRWARRIVDQLPVPVDVV